MLKVTCKFDKGVDVHGLDLKVAHIRAGLTLWQLGRRAGIHPARISEMERGQRAIAESVVAGLEEILGTVPQIAESEELRA
jgi:hypothetical protein